MYILSGIKDYVSFRNTVWTVGQFKSAFYWEQCKFELRKYIHERKMGNGRAVQSNNARI